MGGGEWVEVRGEGATAGIRLHWDSQRFTHFSMCGDMPGFLLAVCVYVCVRVKEKVHHDVKHSFHYNWTL